MHPGRRFFGPGPQTFRFERFLSSRHVDGKSHQIADHGSAKALAFDDEPAHDNLSFIVAIVVVVVVVVAVIHI